MAVEDYNRFTGPALGILMMDTFRGMVAVGEEVTLWSLNRSICDRYKFHGSRRDGMYVKVSRMVKTLESAGLITTKLNIDPDGKTTKRIFPCSEQ